MKRLLTFWATVFFIAIWGVSASWATLIAHYTFDDFTTSDVSGSLTSYNLPSFGNAPDLSKQAYFSDGLSGNYLGVSGPGGMPDWTLSLWVYNFERDQGQFKGLFSNNSSSSADFSFQIDSHDGQYRLISRTTAPNPDFIIGDPNLNAWENIVVQKFSGTNAEVFFNGASLGTTGFNPGGLQDIRLGINRNSNRSFLGYLDNVQIWDDSDQDAAAIYASGPGVNVVPEPSTLLLFGAGGLGLLAFARRRR